MTLALAYNPPLDSYAAWQAASGAAHCERMKATITPAACDENQRKSTTRRGDLRCEFCGGLYNQTKQTPPALALVWDVDKTTETPQETGLDVTAGDDWTETLAALDATIDGLYENPAPGDDFDDVELELDDEELLKLFPELAVKDDGNTEPEIPRLTGYQEAAPRRAVYRGRCKKCGGYMGNIRERDDDNVFRCHACGWRTGPEYERNRAISTAGGGMM